MQQPTKDHYTQAHAQLLPRGLVWNARPGTWLSRLFAAFSRSYVLLHATLMQLLRELDPRSTTQLLEEWEKFAGLPDACSIGVMTESERRSAVVSKITTPGGASIEYFIRLAETLGQPGSTVTEFPVARYGRARFGDRFHGLAWRNVWQMNFSGSGWTPARFTDRFRTRFRQSGNTVLECRITRLKPSHTKVIFHYGD